MEYSVIKKNSGSWKDGPRFGFLSGRTVRNHTFRVYILKARRQGGSLLATTITLKYAAIYCVI